MNSEHDHSKDNPAGVESGSGPTHRLASGKAAILELWERRARACIPAARSIDSLALRDSLPRFLDELAATLSTADVERASKGSGTTLAREHGKVRSEERLYDLSQVIKEYQILQEVILAVLREGGPLNEREQ